MGKIIKREKSVIVACDVSLELYEKIVKETKDIEGIGGYKVGFMLGLNYGLPKIVELTRKYTEKPIIYDHQKAGTDIPDTGKEFARVCKEAGIDAIILFPQAGPETEKAWIEAAKKEGLGVIVGGSMTHPKYKRSEGGYIADEAILEIYLLAAEMGITDFVVPGNKPEEIKRIKEVLEKRGTKSTFYAPGFIAQGGQITEAAKVAGNNWHAIIGRGIYQAENIKKAALEYTSKL
ncbi:orotidine 5'-phosphate decarboxylase [Patescibacteria group bacterium]|nr:orotidine 5'-phosphate decarboxylase [Patescibacteria group bacterium]